MKAINANVTRSLPVGAEIPTADNSGAKVIKIFSVYRVKTVKNRYPAAGVGDLIVASVIKGTPELRGKIVYGTIIRQRKEYLRKDGTRISFEDNAAVVFKDKSGLPKGTLIKGPVAKEACERWPDVAKLAKIIV